MKTKLGLGFMRHDDKNESQKIVDYAMKNNQNYFETCYFYQDFNCENYVYSLLKKYPRDSYEICGKMPIHNILEHQDFEEIYQEQLNKVPEKYFDVYLLQAVSPNCIYWILKYNLIDFFNKEKEKGNIKKFGISIQCDIACLELLLQLHDWDICQMPLNYFDWYLADSEKLYNLLQDKNIPIIAQAPVKGKVLLKEYFNNFSNKQSALNNAYAFLNQLNLQIILCGASKLEHYKENFEAFNNKDILFNEKEAINFLKLYQNDTFIKCINCNQCYWVCPDKLPIPAIFQLYNKSLNNYDSFLDLQILKETIDEPSQHCHGLRCDRLCEKKCPFNNPIKFYLENQIFEARL